MRSSILLLVLSAAVLGGCTSAYKTGQTPDDVYYSPARQSEEYVTIKDNDDRRYQGDDEYYDDRYLRMKVHNRVMWNDLDDWYFYNPRYSYSYYNSWNWNNPWSPYSYWNYYYNPYCSYLVIPSKSTAAYYHPRIFNLNTYNSTQLTNNNYTNPKGSMYSNSYNNYNNGTSRPVRMVGVNPSNNRNSNSNTGNFLRNIFNSSSDNNSNNSSFSSPGRSSSNSSSSSSSSGSSSGSSAPVRKF